MYAHISISRALIIFALLASTTVFAQYGEYDESEPTSDGGYTPYIIGGANPGGNRNCAEVGVAFWDDATHYKCYSAKRDYPDEFGEGFADISGNPECDPDQNITVNVTDGTYVEFWADLYGIGAAIIKGSSNANVYVYDLTGPQVFHDSGLAPPLHPNGIPAGLSNIGGFCWNPIPPDDPPPDECWEDETAWADGDRYNIRKRNWATYTAQADLLSGVTLYAGQFMDAGTVWGSVVGSQMLISIQLNEGWRFGLYPVDDDDGAPIYDNNLKVQDYGSAPSGNPRPGRFMWKAFAEGDYAEIFVPLNRYYGIHVDVEHLVECPD